MQEAECSRQNAVGKRQNVIGSRQNATGSRSMQVDAKVTYRRRQRKISRWWRTLVGNIERIKNTSRSGRSIKSVTRASGVVVQT